MKNTKKFHIIMSENNHRQIKAMAAIRGLTIGEIIEGLVKFASAGKHHPTSERERFEGLLNTCMLDTGTQSKDRAERRQAASVNHGKSKGACLYGAPAVSKGWIANLTLPNSTGIAGEGVPIFFSDIIYLN